LIALIVTSCGDPNEYRVEPVFAEYVQRFELEAAKRGKDYKLQTEGLIIEFAKLKDEQAGLCHYENPIRIEVDSVYWKKISATAGADMMKEDLIFHEMGHGILGRKHLNTILENGDWKSMMCGGTKVDNRPWNINYRRARRDYYVNELFNESTPAPLFTTTELLVDTTGLTQKLWLTFDTGSKTDTGWNLGTNTNYTAEIDNKQLKFTSKYSSSYAILLMVDTIRNGSINIKSDFSFEMEIDSETKTSADQYGLVFAAATKDTTEYFKINREQKMFPGNSAWYSYYTQLHKDAIKKTGKNKLKVVKIDGIIHYFINNVYVYQTEMEIFGYGNNFGFIVPAGGIVWIDNLKIGIKSSSKIKSKAISIKDISFSIVKMKDNNESISNK
jgi:hypothetical protein